MFSKYYGNRLSDDGKASSLQLPRWNHKLRSFSSQEEKVKLDWMQREPQLVQRCAEGQSLETISKEISLLPYGTETLYVSFKEGVKNLSNK